MPFDGKSGVRFDHDPDAVKRAFRESAGETIAALDHLAALFDGGKRWLRNQECDEKGRFCLRGGIAHIAAGDCVGYYLRVAIREFAGRSMSIPAYNDHARISPPLLMSSVAPASWPARTRKVRHLSSEPAALDDERTEQQSLLASNRSTPGFLRRFLEHAG